MSNSVSAIELAAPRTVVLRQGPPQQRGPVAGDPGSGERAFTFTLRRAEKQDWFRYFDGVSVTSETRGREILRTVEAGAASVQLVQDLLTDAQGYERAGDNGSIQLIEDWQSKIPMRHRLAIADVLLDVRAVDAGDAMPEFGQETVALECLWSADEQGRMVRHRMPHTFESPSPDHYKSYMAAVSTSRVVGGSRAGKTIHAGAQKTLCALYDELIVKIDGYWVNGAPIGGNDNCRDGSQNRVAIRQWMDCRHKVAAAERLFAAEEVEQEG